MSHAQTPRAGRAQRQYRRDRHPPRREPEHAVARQSGKSFQELADEAFKDLLKKYRQPVGLKAALKESVREKGKS